MNDTIFAELTYKERIKAVNARLSDPDGRVGSIDELLMYIGKPVYIIISPTTEEYDNVAYTNIIEWSVGTVEDMHGSMINLGDTIDIDNANKYFLYNLDYPDRAIECKDLNIIPNNYNNTAVFHNMEDVNQYTVTRKMMYPRAKGIESDEAKMPFENVQFWLTRDQVSHFCNVTSS